MKTPVYSITQIATLLGISYSRCEKMLDRYCTRYPGFPRRVYTQEAIETLRLFIALRKPSEKKVAV